MCASRGMLACVRTILCIWLCLLTFCTAESGGNCVRPSKGIITSLYTAKEIKTLLLFIDFPDAPAAERTQDVLANTRPLDVIDFYRTSSYGSLTVTIDTYTAQVFRMPQPASSYNYRNNMTSETHRKYVSDALAAVGSGVSFEDVDLVWIVSPRSADNSIPYTTAGYFDPVAADNSTLKGVVTTGTDLFTGNSTLVLARGFAYSLGFRQPCPPSVGDNADDSTFLGSFSPMCADNSLAPDFFAWHKWAAGWLQDSSDVSCLSSSVDQILTLTAIENPDSSVSGSTYPRTKLAVLPLSDTLNLYAEARTHNGLDKQACLVDSTSTGGVLLYTAESIVSPPHSPTINVINTQPGRRPIGCGGTSGRRAFVDLLVSNSSTGLASSFKLPDYDVKVEITGGSPDGSQFDVRFRTGVGSESSANASSAASSSSTAATSTSATLQPSQTSDAPATTTSPSSGPVKTHVGIGGFFLSALAALFAVI